MADLLQMLEGGDDDAFFARLPAVLQEEHAELLRSWGRAEDLVEMLSARRHVLHREDPGGLRAWVEGHLVEAEPLNLFDVDSTDGDGRDLVALAEAGGDPRCLELAREAAARGPRPVDPARAARPCNSPHEEGFLAACQAGRVDEVRQLLADDPSLAAAENKWAQNGLHLQGAYASSVPCTEVLCAAGTPRPASVLVTCAWWGASDIIETILRAGGAPIRAGADQSAIWTAAIAARFEQATTEQAARIAELLLPHGGDLDDCSRWGVTVWGIAPEPLRSRLAELGAKPERSTPGHAEVLAAVERGDATDALERLGANPRLLHAHGPDHGCSLLVRALDLGHEALAGALEAHKAAACGLDLNEAAAVGDTARLAQLLEEHGIRGPRTRGHGVPERPLHHAAWFGQLGAARLLLDRGASAGEVNHELVDGSHVGPVDSRNRNPIQIAALRGQASVLELFLDRLRTHRPADLPV